MEEASQAMNDQASQRQHLRLREIRDVSLESKKLLAPDCAVKLMLVTQPRTRWTS